jgi:urease accessory protein
MPLLEQASHRPAAVGWSARLALRFVAGPAGTLLKERQHNGPLRVQRPFYPETSQVCHVYLLHPPGGVVGGDKLEIIADVGSAAHALLTTPAATKFYRSAGPRAEQHQHWRLACDATLEWLPQENIVFDGANARQVTRVDLAGGARFLGWEITCLGRPASAAPFSSGTYAANIELWREERPLYLERARFRGGDVLLSEPWGLAGQSVTGTLLCTGDYTGALPELRERGAAVLPEGWIGITQLPEVLVCRYLGPSTEHARRCFWTLWETLRPLALGRVAARPRIWDT